MRFSRAGGLCAVAQRVEGSQTLGEQRVAVAQASRAGSVARMDALESVHRRVFMYTLRIFRGEIHGDASAMLVAALTLL